MCGKKVAIIGGGCCGLLLANLIKDFNLNITIFEKNNKLGKKILASGNGKCNFTNLLDFDGKYNDDFAQKIINKFDVSETISVLENMGLIYKSDLEGRCYPVSECSSSVLECLKLNLKNVRVVLDSVVYKIERFKDKYKVILEDKEEFFDYVVCCSGSASSNLGSLKAYEYFSCLDIRVTALKPSLVPLKVKENVGSLKGIRVKCLIKLVDDNDMLIYEEYGEVMFKDNGLSGIAIFNASSYINRKEGKYKIILDLSNGISNSELYKYITSKKEYYPKIFTGFLNEKIENYIMRDMGNIYIEKKVKEIIERITSLTFNVVGAYPLVDSQVCSGGVSLKEINENLELIKYPNIYVGGEVLDIDGMCGGYNMQFAWSCAGVIAQNIKNKLDKINL